MSVSKVEEKKFRVIQVMKVAGYVNKLCYITVLYYCGSSHWRCSGLNFVTFNRVPRVILKKAYKFMAVKLLMKLLSPPRYSLIYS